MKVLCIKVVQLACQTLIDFSYNINKIRGMGGLHLVAWAMMLNKEFFAVRISQTKIHLVTEGTHTTERKQTFTMFLCPGQAKFCIKPINIHDLQQSL
jgi:hypothetical protein